MPANCMLTLTVLLIGLAAPAALAQETAVARVGLIGLTEGDCGNQPFREGMRHLGCREGENPTECRHGGGHYDRLQRAAREVARAHPDVIVALTHLTADAAHAATASIPIVFVASSDPVVGGFAATLPRPGGNMTRLTDYSGELNAKRPELLKAVAPTVQCVAVLASPYLSASVNEVYVRDVTAAAETLGLEIRVFRSPEGEDLESVFAQLDAWKADAVYLLPTILFAYQAQEIADLANWCGLPSMHWYKPFAAMGGLMADGVDYPTMQRRAAVYVDKILKGADPADLLVEQPTQYELIVNRETADQLELTIPPSIALRADRIIE